MRSFAFMDDLFQLQQFIITALAEDLGDGDHSTLCCINEDVKGKAILKIKEPGILAGVDVAIKIFAQIDPSAEIKILIPDGTKVNPGEVAFEVLAPIHSILKCERLVLNCMQRMSGIATLTNKYVEKISGYKCQLLDTRKTTPLFRLLEKDAVRIGGGMNHRFGLYDMIMLKDNHIDYCGSLEKAIESAYQYTLTNNKKLKIEVETRNIDDVKKVMLIGKINRIMLDNFTPEEIAEALIIIDRKYETEASGGINYDNIEKYASTGVDFISCGSIIHHASSLDLSLKAVVI